MDFKQPRSCNQLSAIAAFVFCVWLARFPFAAMAQVETKPDFKQYLRRSVMSKVCRNWTPTRANKVSPIKLKWKIFRNGTIADVRVSDPGKLPTGEARAIAAVLKSAPFDPLPAGSPPFKEIEIQLETTTALQLTVPQALKYYGPNARKSLREKCAAMSLQYPPKHLTLITLKEERKLLMFGGNELKQMNLIGTFPLVSYCGGLGPKLKQGDLQIPEGIYGITGSQAFNMLALCVNYPNEVDRKNAASDHRTNLGGDILIHGGSQSTGCVVVSDDDMEQIFVAVNDAGYKNVELIMAPCDLTKNWPRLDMTKQPSWLPQLYKAIKERMSIYSL